MAVPGELSSVAAFSSTNLLSRLRTASFKRYSIWPFTLRNSCFAQRLQGLVQGGTDAEQK